MNVAKGLLLHDLMVSSLLLSRVYTTDFLTLAEAELDTSNLCRDLYNCHDGIETSAENVG